MVRRKAKVIGDGTASVATEILEMPEPWDNQLQQQEGWSKANQSLPKKLLCAEDDRAGEGRLFSPFGV